MIGWMGRKEMQGASEGRDEVFADGNGRDAEGGDQ